MKLDSVRELKQLIQINPPTPKVQIQPARWGRRKSSLSIQKHTLAFAIGVSRSSGKKDEYKLALRIRDKQDLHRPEINQIFKMAHNEVDVRVTGKVKRQHAPWHQQNNRPLAIGSSIGHYLVTAGTLGCFIKKRGGSSKETFVLSNNHVLANENSGKVNDAIYQRAVLDGGTSLDIVAELADFVPLQQSNNLVDAAIGRVNPIIGCDTKTLKNIGIFSGPSTISVDDGMPVSKIGRTTGLTHGRVTAFEMDDVEIDYGIGSLRFDSQIEIEGTGNTAFSAGGDSGSLILDEKLGAVGLLFAGSEQGGTNGAGLTYANPIGSVLDALQIDLLF